MNLLIRADASAEIGTGHVMRCLALAQAWQDEGGTVTFASASLPSGLEARLQTQGVNVVRLQSAVEDPLETTALARALGALWVVIDGYRFDGAFQAQLKQAGLRLLAIDDIGHAGHYSADLLLNQNLHASASLYADREPSTKLLLGLAYTLLRREFRSKPRRGRATPECVSNLLITLGGSDPCNYTARVLRSLSLNGSFFGKVVLGDGNPYGAAVRKVIREVGSKMELLIDVKDMSEVMAGADLAIASGGISIWELAFLGVPTIAFSQGPQETMLLQAAEAKGLCVFAGDFADLSAEGLDRAMMRLLPAGARREMVQKQQMILDGQGAARVIAEIRELS